ncbi:oleosin 1-like [Malania oleifera]|uniref:oleosin 1-like n=1 Tax=Malania oleifera TaxID=397392 RepID=UPI0025AE6237|nr:oleosin 1-like [Malania oleifera]
MAMVMNPQSQGGLSYQVVRASTAVTIGSSLLVLSGLTLAGTVIGLAVATPGLVLFSPVLVPAAITLFLVTAGLVASGGLGMTAVYVFYWMYKYLSGKHPVGADQIDRARVKLTGTAMDIRERAEHLVTGS